MSDYTKKMSKLINPHIEDADIVADLSGGKLYILKAKERIEELKVDNKNLTKQRDGLLEACKVAEKELEQRYKAQEGSSIDNLALKIVKAAIAEVKKEIK